MATRKKPKESRQVEKLRDALAREKAKGAAFAKERSEAREQQAVAAEILKIISRSPDDAQPVFDAIVKRALRLMKGHSAIVTRVVDGMLHLAALTSTSKTGDTVLRRFYPRPIVQHRHAQHGTAIRLRRPTFVADTEKLPKAHASARNLSRARGYRSMVVVPLLQGGAAIGTISVTRKEPGSFSKQEIDLLQTFAAQAVIAIENVRRFNETKEALERQTATAEILKVISSSPTDIRPVLDAVCKSAAHLCEATDVLIRRVEAGVLRAVAHVGSIPLPDEIAAPPVSPTHIAGRSVLERRTIHVHDVTDAEVLREYPNSLAKAQKGRGFRTLLIVPLLRGDEAIGVIGIRRVEKRPFSEQQIKLLQSFADQAVIAIENVRLFNETKEALEQQRASAEVLGAISGSMADSQPVFDHILKSCERLFAGRLVGINLLGADGNLYLGAYRGEGRERFEKIFPLPVSEGSGSGMSIVRREVVHYPDVESDTSVPAPTREGCRAIGVRSVIFAPMLSEDIGIGAIFVGRPNPGPFSGKEIDLLRSFANQAAISIKNVRLFNATKEALERQTATSDILRVISSSPSDLAPVFDAILDSATRLCDAHFGVLNLHDGTNLRTAAHRGCSPQFADWLRERGAFQPTTSMASMIASREPIQVRDLRDSESYREGLVHSKQFVDLGGARSYLAVPLVKDDQVLGFIAIYRPEVRPFSDKQVELVKAFSAQAVIAIENVRLFNETKEALERQTATAEVLRAISTSPTDTRPVFDAILERAAKLCGAENGILFRYAEGAYHALATRVPNPELAVLFREPRRPPPGSKSGLGQLTRVKHVVHIPDMLSDAATVENDPLRAETLKGGMRSWLGVPLLKDGELTGAIVLYRSEPAPFSPAQIALLETFAEQAVIAIENVRLFNETKEALERQTAISEVLRVISSSPSDVQPVLEAVAVRAAKICDASDARIALVEGDHFRHAAGFGDLPPARVHFPLGRGAPIGRAVIDRTTVYIRDIQAETGDDYALAREIAAQSGWRSNLVVPLMRKDTAVGAIALRRRDVRPFTAKQISLLQTFADQAAIAIENVRLFNETREALERQTATAEILKVIAASPDNVQPVFDAIVRSATGLMNGFSTTLTLVADGKLNLCAFTSAADGGEQALHQFFPIPVEGTQMGEVVLTKRPSVIVDTESSDTPEQRLLARARGFRSVVFVPLIRGETAIGTLNVTRREPGVFTAHQIELLKTFADQAVIAIENVRLFNETKEALERQTATAEVLKVISGSLTDTQPVFDTIAERAARLTGASFGWVFTFDGERIHAASHFGLNAPAIEQVLKLFPMRPSGASYTARAIRDAMILNVADALAETDPEYITKPIAALGGYRSVLAVPMFRDRQVVGAIAVNRAEPGRFADKQVELLKTFADQAVIAIENVRLFNQTKESLERQTATAEILKVIASSPSDVQPVFDAIAASARQLLNGGAALVNRRVGDMLELAAYTSTGEAGDAALTKLFPSKLTGKGHMGKAILSAAPVLISDIEAEDSYSNEFKADARTRGVRSIVSVPMMKDGEAIGGISVNRPVPGNFTEHQTNLLRTFADQAVIAIENVRLFNETKEALERQTATAEILKVIASSPSDVQPVFDAIVHAAARLFDRKAGLRIVEGDRLRRCARSWNPTEFHGDDVLPLNSDSLVGLVVLAGKAMQVADKLSPDAPPYARENAARLSWRSLASAPLLREGNAIGCISVSSSRPGPLSDKQMDLLATFADQAVIAIENVRLFKELEARTNALGKSVEKLTALGEVGQAISSTLELETVLKTIATHAVQLTGLDGASIYEYDEVSEVFRVQAADNLAPAFLQTIRDTPIRKGDGTVGGVAIARKPVQVPDIRDESYQSSRKELLIRAGYRAMLTVPLLHEDHIIGALSVTRKTPGAFADEVVELMETFATQSAMAIQNARLFREIEEKGKQLEEASKHKSQFLASMSHELRTPLNAILGFNEMILGDVYGEVPSDMKEPLTDIQTSGKHLLRLINNVLDLAKIEAGRMELALDEYSVHDTVESVRSTLRPLAEAKGLELAVNVPPDIPLARGDGGRITQCLMNLAGNSLKFTKQGSVGIAVVLENGTLTYKVKDTGIGIPADKIGSLFTEFKQTDATIASEYGGTGLGLSISKKFIEMHGGRIWAESEPGIGSTFIFEVPLRASEVRES